ncbi:EmrB/QacA subfamily drug resistance transporter [Panacagrimonas perspica]|uniref:EmrB/QacA subfamily drug resistance transporter n=1 Tax=Panacagrimonas perspica TaxID=381431 RepID=A0A4R7P562_9GAMM|nr:DHA2 family efflux MFS transporter permease subunit [Panacagrimonas perspica]TDU28867.1 EmrB/QacA subfamily drug resistance transporter [Panacagrimonas perspica]THD02305.1 MFS transporter [Panacagrimonas perspica]
MNVGAPTSGADAEIAVKRGWSVFRIASIAVFLVSLDSTVLFAAFGALRQGFPDASAADLSWVLNAYTVVFAAMLIPAGGLADRLGRKMIFLIGVGVFLAASAACGLSTTVELLVAARILQAVGAALLTPSSFSLVLDAFPLSHRALAVSAWGAVGALAAATGPGLGALIVDTMGWSWAFYLNLPLGAYCFWRAQRTLAESSKPAVKRPLDWTGMATMIVGVGAVLTAIVQHGSPDWSSQEIAFAAIVGGTALAAFVVWMRMSKEPLVPPELFRDANYRFANMATFVFGVAFSMMFFAFFFYMTNIWGFSLPRAGMAIMPGPLTVIPTAIAVGKLAGRFGHRRILLTGSMVYAASGVWFMLVPGTEPHYATAWLPGLIVSGIGVGMIMPSLSGATVANLAPVHYGVGNGFNQALRQIGGTVGVAVTIVLLGNEQLSRADFSVTYASHVALALLVGLLCLGLQQSPRAAPASTAVAAAKT